MNKVLNIMINTFKPWFAVDTRALGLFRIVFGILCLSDIIRRWDFIDIFYTQASIIQSTLTSSSYKNFTLLNLFPNIKFLKILKTASLTLLLLFLIIISIFYRFINVIYQIFS